jgi:aminoglycoside phosphotransferase (APT) family kinase protein
VAEAIHKLYRAGVPTEKSHSMEDELRILRECFAKVAAIRPAWTGRLAKLQIACEQLGASVGNPTTCGIHRDFYSAQVIVDNPRLWLIDFDLYCQGDPGLDVGNFIGHITEQALRERGDAKALMEIERTLEDRFVDLSGEVVRPSVRAYTTLTLARHIFLSTRFPERAHLTERLLELCEERAGARSSCFA